jgi:sporulation protein YlmC with PRC-barrel domain
MLRPRRCRPPHPTVGPSLTTTQDIYDPHQSKIGSVDDVLVDKSGKVTGLVIGVGGFLDMGEKDVIMPFTAVKSEKKNDK